MQRSRNGEMIVRSKEVVCSVCSVRHLSSTWCIAQTAPTSSDSSESPSSPHRQGCLGWMGDVIGLAILAGVLDQLAHLTS
jgi:hypothetical protein